MIRIYIRKKSQDHGRVFKSKTSIKNDPVKILSWINFVTNDLISEEELAQSEQLISEKFGLYIRETYINGNSKVGRYLPYFSWTTIITQNK